MRAWVWVAFAIAVCVGALAGCDRQDRHAAAVLSRYEAGQRAIAAGNGMEYFEMKSAQSQAAEADLIEIALTGSRDEVRLLPPTSIALVLALRNRMEPSRLRKMTVEDLVAFQIADKLLTVDAERGVVPVDVTVNGDKAHIQMGLKHRDLRTFFMPSRIESIAHMEYHYVRVNGQWFINKAATDVALAKMNKYAPWAPIDTLIEILEGNERIEYYGTLKPNIWSPVGK
jgi:hypothetical protein